jgi:Nucleotidyltransferase domain.
MPGLGINYPSLNHKNYIEAIYHHCKNNKLSLILKGSMAKGTATKHSDIDLIVSGDIDGSEIDRFIKLYGSPVMTNFTENPKGILILVYQDNITVDLDIRETITEEDLKDSKILLKFDENFTLDNESIIRKKIISRYMLERPAWYKMLRILHRCAIKYLSNKKDDAAILLAETKDSIFELAVDDIYYKNNIADDLQIIFDSICSKFQVEQQIIVLFNNLFKEFDSV